MIKEKVAAALKNSFATIPACEQRISLASWRLRCSNRRIRLLFLEPHRHSHSHHRNNDTDEGKTKHDAIGIELW